MEARSHLTPAHRTAVTKEHVLIKCRNTTYLTQPLRFDLCEGGSTIISFNGACRIGEWSKDFAWFDRMERRFGCARHPPLTSVESKTECLASLSLLKYILTALVQGICRNFLHYFFSALSLSIEASSSRYPSRNSSLTRLVCGIEALVCLLVLAQKVLTASHGWIPAENGWRVSSFTLSKNTVEMKLLQEFYKVLFSCEAWSLLTTHEVST